MQTPTQRLGLKVEFNDRFPNPDAAMKALVGAINALGGSVTEASPLMPDGSRAIRLVIDDTRVLEVSAKEWTTDIVPQGALAVSLDRRYVLVKSVSSPLGVEKRGSPPQPQPQESVPQGRPNDYAETVLAARRKEIRQRELERMEWLARRARRSPSGRVTSKQLAIAAYI